MHGSHAVVELGKCIIREIQAAVFVDVHLGAGKNPEIPIASVEPGDSGELI